MNGKKAKLLRKLATKVAVTDNEMIAGEQRKWDILSLQGSYRRFKEMYKRTSNKNKLNKIAVETFKEEE